MNDYIEWLFNNVLKNEVSTGIKFQMTDANKEKAIVP